MDKIIQKECPKHGLTYFIWEPSRNGYRCTKCETEAVKRRRYKVKQMLIDYKGGKCEICGYDRCVDSLEFHHINPNEKEFNIASVGTRSINILKKEVDKCVLVCANCHREIHSAKNNGGEYRKNIPIVEEEKEKHYCLVCGKEIHTKHNKFCSHECHNKFERKTNASAEEIIEVFSEYKTFVGTGTYFGVTDNGLRKIAKRLGILEKLYEIKNLKSLRGAIG